jgi:ech hydrogenase subunit D
MIGEQKIINIDMNSLLSKVKEYFDSGCRLVQISATKVPAGLEINYSFDKDYVFTNLRLSMADVSQEIPSVTPIYWSAFLYENELHDLYGVKVKGINVDYKGNFYRTQVKHAFNPDVKKDI